MQAVILAAGQSSRFYPYNSFGHKSLTVLGGKSLFLKTLESIREAGIKNIVVVEDSSQLISKSLSEDDIKDVKIQFVIQENPTGMGDALLCARFCLEEKFFLVNAYHFEFSNFVKDFNDAQKSEGDLVLLTKEEKDVSDFGSFERVNGKLVVSEKKEGKNLERIVGIYLLNKKFVDILHNEEKNHYSFENALSSYSQNNEIILLSAKKETLSLKYPWDLLTVKDYILNSIKSHKAHSAQVSEKAVITGEVYVDDGATVMDGAVIVGPAYIGKNAYIGTNAIIRGGVCIEERVVVGAHMEVKNSVIMRGTTTHSGFIGDSVIGEKTSLAAGFISGNVRLDKEEVEVLVKGKKVSSHRKYFGTIIGSNSALGIKIGTMPGVVIGNNVLVGPSTTVMENIEDHTTYYTEFKAIVKKDK